MNENYVRCRFQRSNSSFGSIQAGIKLSQLIIVCGITTVRNGSPCKYPQLLCLLTGDHAVATNLLSIFWRLGGCLELTSGHATAMLLSTQMHEHSSWDIKRRHQGGWMSGRFRVGIAIRNKHAPVHLRCKPTLGNAFHYHLALPGSGCSFLKIEKSCLLPQVFLCF